MLKPSSEQDIYDIHEAAKADRVDLIPRFILSEEDLNRPKNSLHIIHRAANHGHSGFIRKVYEFAAAKGWKIVYDVESRDEHPFFFAVMDRFYCTQALALRETPPAFIYFTAGEGDNRKTNQCLLTLLGLTTDPELKKYGMNQALLGAMGYSNKLNFQRFELLIELGANPHALKHDGSINRLETALSMACTSYLRGEKTITLLLSALNSSKIIRNKKYYLSSLNDFFANEHYNPNVTEAAKMEAFMADENETRLTDTMRPDKNKGSGFLHWMSSSGHDELLDDMIESLIAHDSLWVLIVPDRSDKTPLFHAIEKNHHLIAQRLIIEQLKLDFHFHKNDRAYLLKWIDSTEINDNAQFYLDSLNKFIDEDTIEIEGKRKPARSTLLHWAVQCGHTKILPDIIRCFELHGIDIHKKNKANLSAADLATQLDDLNSAEALNNSHNTSNRNRVPTLKKLCLHAHNQVLIKDETTFASFKDRGIPVEVLEKMDLKPNFRLVRVLNREFHEQEGKTPLIVMCERNELTLAQNLIPYLTPVDLVMAAEDGNTALHIACRSSSSEIIDLLMTKCSSLLTTKNNLGLIPILCANRERRLAIIEHDNSGEVFKSLFYEVEDNIAKIVDAETQQYLSRNSGFFSGFSSYTRQASELSQKIKANRSSRYRAPSPIAITLFCNHLENPGTLERGYLNFHLLQTINSNIVLKTALDLPDANFENQESSRQYCQLVVQKLNQLVPQIERLLRRKDVEPGSAKVERVTL